MIIKKVLFILLFSCALYGGDTAIDRDTGLMWQDDAGVIKKRVTYAEAQSYCKQLTLEGYHDWHVPHIDALMSLSYKKFNRPALKWLFVYANSEWFWSETTFAGNSAKAWMVNFFYGSDDYRIKSEKAFVRCVRYDDK